MNQEHLFVESLPKSVHKSVNWKINRAKASIRATIFARNPITKGVTSTIENISMFYQIEFHWSSYHIIAYDHFYFSPNEIANARYGVSNILLGEKLCNHLPIN